MLVKKTTVGHYCSGHVIALTVCIQSVCYDVIPNCVFCNILASVPSICLYCSQKHSKILIFKYNLYFLFKSGHKCVRASKTLQFLPT